MSLFGAQLNINFLDIKIIISILYFSKHTFVKSKLLVLEKKH